MAERAEAEGLDQPSRLFGRIDMRHDDTERPIVERARALIERARANAHDRHHPQRQRRHGDLCDFGGRDGAVLRVDEQPIVTGGLGEQGDRRAAQMLHAEPERQLAVA